jgi:hypothetical protein
MKNTNILNTKIKINIVIKSLNHGLSDLSLISTVIWIGKINWKDSDWIVYF